MYDTGNRPQPHAPAGAPLHNHSLIHRSLIGVAVAIATVFGLSLFGISTASAAAPAGGHSGFASDSQGGGDGGGGGGGGTWDQSKVPLPHLPGQAPVFVLQSQTVADVAALDQTSEAAADASMIAFYANNTACVVDTHPEPDVQFTIICPRGTATVTDTAPVFAGEWVHVFRLVH